MSEAENLLLDTNVLLYSFDRNEPVKGPAAQALLAALVAAGRPLVSTQVVSEFYWNVTRKIAIPLTHAQAIAEINSLSTLMQVVPVTYDTIVKALDAVGQHGLPLWDAQIFAAAKLNGATTVLSADFQHRGVIEGVTFLNPFAADFDLNTLLAP